MSESRLVALARELVRTPSVTTEGTLRAAELLRDAVLGGGDAGVSLLPGPSESQVTLLAVQGLGSLPPLLLNSHLDTVPPGDPGAWTECDGDPFAGIVRDGFLYGLGSADAKLDGLCKALALESLRGCRLRRGVVLAGTWGEERGLLGARDLLPRLPERPAAAWVGEPTELRLVTRHKGLLVVSLEALAPKRGSSGEAATTRILVRGRSAHSSTPHLGENAVFRALDVVSERGLGLVSLSGGDAANKVPALCEIEVAGEVDATKLGAGCEAAGYGAGAPLPEILVRFLVEAAHEVRRIAASPPRRDESFDPPVRTASLGLARAASGRACLTLDVRPLPGEATDDARAGLERLADPFRREGLDVRVAVERDNPALEAAARSPAADWSAAVLGSLGLPSTPVTKAGCTEAGLYAAAGIPTVVFGPGRSAGNIHRPNERVALAELEGAVAFYTRLLREVCAA